MLVYWKVCKKYDLSHTVTTAGALLDLMSAKKEVGIIMNVIDVVVGIYSDAKQR